MRATSHQWPRWMLRQLLMPIVALPCTITVRTGARYRLGRDPVDDSLVRYIHTAGEPLYFPPFETGSEDGLVLDIGAHHGVYAVEALRRYPRYRLVALEPDPDACACLAANLALNDLSTRAEVVQAGLHVALTPGWLTRRAGGSWSGRTVPALADPVQSAERRSGVPVPLITLRRLLGDRKPVIVKSNAEGAEFTLIPQLLELGLRPRLVILMTHSEAGSPDDLVERLAEAGYLVRDVDQPPRNHRFHAWLAGSARQPVVKR